MNTSSISMSTSAITDGYHYLSDKTKNLGKLPILSVFGKNECKSPLNKSVSQLPSHPLTQSIRSTLMPKDLSQHPLALNFENQPFIKLRSYYKDKNIEIFKQILNVADLFGCFKLRMDRLTEKYNHPDRIPLLILMKMQSNPKFELLLTQEEDVRFFKDFFQKQTISETLKIVQDKWQEREEVIGYRCKLLPSSVRQVEIELNFEYNFNPPEILCRSYQINKDLETLERILDKADSFNSYILNCIRFWQIGPFEDEARLIVRKMRENPKLEFYVSDSKFELFKRIWLEEGNNEEQLQFTVVQKDKWITEYHCKFDPKTVPTQFSQLATVMVDITPYMQDRHIETFKNILRNYLDAQTYLCMDHITQEESDVICDMLLDVPQFEFRFGSEKEIEILVKTFAERYYNPTEMLTFLQVSGDSSFYVCKLKELPLTQHSQLYYMPEEPTFEKGQGLLIKEGQYYICTKEDAEQIRLNHYYVQPDLKIRPSQIMIANKKEIGQIREHRKYEETRKAILKRAQLVSADRPITAFRKNGEEITIPSHSLKVLSEQDCAELVQLGQTYQEYLNIKA